MTSATGKTNQIDLNVPPKVLVGEIQNTTNLDSWPYANAPDDPWYASGSSPRPHQWEMEISITPQAHGSNLTRDDYQFTGNDVRVGDWIAYLNDGACLKIVSVTAKTDINVTVVVEDYLRYNTFRSPTGQGLGSGTNIAIFTLSEAGKPVLDSNINSASDIFYRNVVSRFEYLDQQYNYVLSQQNHGFANGDVIAVTGSGFVKGNSEVASKMVGVVSQLGPGPHQFMINPNQQMIDYRVDIPGNQGDFVYVDSDGDLTLSSNTSTQKLAYLIVSDSVPSVKTGDVANPTVTPGTQIEVNGEPVIIGGTGNITAMVNAINGVTANTFVTASETGAPTEAQSSDGAGTAYGLVGGFVPFSASINGVTVNFITSDAGQASFGQPVSIPQDMKTDIDAAGIPGIQVRLDSAGQFTIIEENGGSITITEVSPDANTNGFFSLTGLAAFTPASTDKLLRLTEPRGGEINIYDPSLAFTAATGVFSSHTGRPVTAMNIEQGIRTGGLYVVADIPARDNINTIVGDQAYVLNKGDGEWGLYVYNGSSWIQTADQDSADVDAKTLVATYDVSLGGNTTVPLGNISVGRKITSIGIEVNTAFDGVPFSEVAVTSLDGTEIFADAGASDLNSLGRYVTNPNYVHSDVAGQEVPVVANVSLNGATVGNVTVRLTYV